MNLTIVILLPIFLIAATLYVRQAFNKQEEAFDAHLQKNGFRRQRNLKWSEAIKLILLLPILLLAIAIVWQLLFTKQWAASLAFGSFMLFFIALYYWSKKPFNWKKISK